MYGTSVIFSFSFIFSAFSRKLRSRARSKNARRFLSWSISASSSVVHNLLSESHRGLPLCLPDPLQVGSSCVARSRVQALYPERHLQPPMPTKWRVETREHFSSSGICQSPFLASNTVNSLVFFSRVLTSSTVGIG